MVQKNNRTTKTLVINILAKKFAFLKLFYVVGIVVVAPNNHYQPMPAVQKSNSEYERGDVALGAVPPNNEYGQLAVRPAYDELLLKPPGTDYADASILQ